MSLMCGRSRYLHERRRERTGLVVARKELLVKEKALTSARDELNSARRQLPMVEVTKQYTLHGEQGPVGMVDLFEGS